MQSISKKSEESLYSTVSDGIMDARLKIEKIPEISPTQKDKIDKILFDLSISAPWKAIQCFNLKD